MKKIAKLTLAAAAVIMAGASAMGQTVAEDPRYGSDPAQRTENLKKLNFLRDEVQARNWNAAAVYIKELMNDAPAASSNIYIWGATVYKNKVNAAKSPEERKALVDSVMLIYDRRIANYGATANNGSFVPQLKAQDFLVLSPQDRAGVRKLYQEAVDAAGAAAKPDLVLTYFQQLVTDFKGVEISPEELLTAYEKLNPLMTGATQEEKDSMTALFATSGAADCGVLEGLYSKELAAKPGDKDLLTKAYTLMSMAGCDSPFYLSVAEQLYAAEPTSELAVRLASMFEKQQQYSKALEYVNKMIESESDPAAKANLYVRIAASELGLRHSSAAAQAARQAIQLDSNNGYAHMFLAEAYISGAAACGGFHAQTVFWLAYDELARAREALAGDAAAIENVNNRMANCRANFPSFEEGFMYVQGYANGNSYQVSCGWISGTTTIRSR